ncbi:MAG TPA: hypothetical protein VIM28_10985 [Solirubrobacterales bacterium]
MVAGRRFWGHSEERAAQHQAGGGGDLGIEAVVEDRLGAGEAGRLDTRVEAGRQVDEEDDGKADQAEHEDDSSQAPPSLVAQRDQGQKGREQRDGNQQECVCLAGGLHVHRRRGRRWQPGIAQLVDLDRAVVDELRSDQTGGSGEDGEAGRPLRGEHGADAGCAASRLGGTAQ